MNISKISDCYGCGVCAMVCPKHIIEIKLNDEGFYEPHIIALNQCIDCGLCIDVCSYSHDGLGLNHVPFKSYSAWSKEYAVHRKCSSGGVGFELGRTLMKQGYKVCGVRYNTDLNRAEHYIASNVLELIESIGSKYIQSYTVDGFKAINRKEKYLVTGTPCQIDSFRRYIRKFKKEDNFVLMDFFSHGVPSMLLWNKYVAWAETKVGKLTYVSWRNKFTGWHDSWAMSIDGILEADPVECPHSYNLLMKGKKGALNSRLSQGDMFYKLFLSDACLGKACYDRCKFKYDHSSADIRLGDLWGKNYEKDKDGVSAVVTFTQKGEDVLHQCNCELREHPFDIVAEGQMRTCPSKDKSQILLSKILKKEDSTIIDVYNALRRYRNVRRWKNGLAHPLKTVLKLLERNQ